MKLLRVVGLICVAALAGTAEEHWVATWTTAQSLTQTRPPAQSPTARGFHNQTVRMIARTSIAGKRVRVKLENAFGADPVTVAAVHIALREKDSAIVPATDHALTFNGKPGVTLGPGMVILSDPADLTLPALADVAVSIYFPEDTGAPTVHSTALHHTYISREGDTTAAPAMEDARVTQAYYWLAGIDVMAPSNAFTIVTYGDSITDGTRSTTETDHSWPALLAARLAGGNKTKLVAIANMGISGNRVLRDGAGASALARFDRDVLSQSGVKWMMLLEGINDIGHGTTTPGETLEASDIIGGYKQLIERAHTHGIRVVGCTLTPFVGASYQRDTGEAIREAVNQWIRTSGAFDAVVDFEKATRDAADPTRIRADFDPGDHLHPNDAGYEAIAAAIDLAIFTKK